MKDIKISASSTSKELEPLARAIHNVVRLPVVLASVNKSGIIIEKDKVETYDYSGPILERVLKENKVLRITPKTGKYKDVPFIVSPIKNEDGEVIAAIGIVDMYGVVDMAELFSTYPEVTRQTEACFRKIYGDKLPTRDDGTVV